MGRTAGGSFKEEDINYRQHQLIQLPPSNQKRGSTTILLPQEEEGFLLAQAISPANGNTAVQPMRSHDHLNP